MPAAVDVIEPSGLAGWIGTLADAGRVAVYRGEIGGWAPPPAAAAVQGGAAARRHAGSPRPRGARHGRERLLATSLPSPAGWRATAGGRPLIRLTVDGAYLGVLCPAGVSRLSLDFAPPGLAAGLALGALALGALGALLWMALRSGARRAGARATLRPIPFVD